MKFLNQIFANDCHRWNCRDCLSWKTTEKSDRFGAVEKVQNSSDHTTRNKMQIWNFAHWLWRVRLFSSFHSQECENFYIQKSDICICFSCYKIFQEIGPDEINIVLKHADLYLSFYLVNDGWVSWFEDDNADKSLNSISILRNLLLRERGKYIVKL